MSEGEPIQQEEVNLQQSTLEGSIINPTAQVAEQPLVEKKDSDTVISPLIDHDMKNGLFSPVVEPGVVEEDGGASAAKRTLWSAMIRENPDQALSDIRSQALKFYQETGKLSVYALGKAKQSGLGAAITIHYPGGIQKIREELGIDAPHKELGFWTPESIENEARNLIANGGKINHEYLKQIGRADLSSAISSYYPGATGALREKLGLVEGGHKPKGFWTSERVVQSAAEFYREHGDISHQLLAENDSSSLSSAITKYEGGMDAVKTLLGISPGRKPNGYWQDPANIEKEALDFYIKEGALTVPALREKGSQLGPIISAQYPGGMNALKERLGVALSQYPEGYWTEDKIKKAVEEYCSTGARLTGRVLEASGNSDLLYVIGRYYPGGIVELRNALGIKLEEIPSVWNPERIEREAFEFFQLHGDITPTLMIDNKNSGLSAAIAKHYPGGRKALREKLGLTKHDLGANPDQADELMKGLEEET